MIPATFLQPDGKARIASLAIDQTVKAHCLELIEQGYTMIKRAIPQADCTAALAAFRDHARRHHEIFVKHQLPTGRHQRIVNLHLLIPELLALFTRNPLLLAVQDACFGAPASLYTSLFYEVGSQQAIHRDSPYFATRPEYSYFGSTVYLERADDENGCLEVIEGGHTVPELDREAMAISRFGSLDAITGIDVGLWVEYQDEVVRRCRERGLPIRRIHADAGDTLIWHPQLPHGGTPIKNAARTRNSLVLHTTPAGMPVYNADAFFRPSVAYPLAPRWPYSETDGRQIAAHGGVSFGQEGTYALAAFYAGS